MIRVLTLLVCVLVSSGCQRPGPWGDGPREHLPEEAITAVLLSGRLSHCTDVPMFDFNVGNCFDIFLSFFFVNVTMCFAYFCFFKLK